MKRAPIAIASAALLVLSGCASTSPIGPAMSNCFEETHEYALTEQATPNNNTDWIAWAHEFCEWDLEQRGEAAFVETWGD